MPFFHQALELDDVVVEAPAEYLSRLRTVGMVLAHIHKSRSSSGTWQSTFASVMVAFITTARSMII